MTNLKLLLDYIGSTLGDSASFQVEDDDYAALPLCVIDAVYSIGVRYESTERTVKDFLNWSRWDYEHEYSIDEFLDFLLPYNNRWQALASEVFRNRQRTSTRSGILKAEAVYRFAEVLQQFGIGALADVTKINGNSRMEAGIRAIRGQASGISYRYFLMLAGFRDLVKPDRMVTRFVSEALGMPKVAPERAAQLIRSAAYVLKSRSPEITPSLLDYRIWQFQRTRRAPNRLSRSGRNDCIVARLTSNRLC